MASTLESLPETLTEKEKETLRLLLRGHDAKSSASELDLSVHTINERLRSARRKLDVTSSREAARVLFESEGGTYENSGYETSGDAEGGRDPDQPTGGQFRPLLIGGILAMLSLALIAALALSDTPARERPIGDPATPIETAQLEAFEAAARDWLALVDASAWEASYATAGASFQEPNTVAGWRDASLQARVPLGAVIDRQTQTAEYVNAPPHGYVIMKFRTQFEGDSDALEAVTLEREDGAWKVVGYVID